jgi:hypothetical protein
MIRSEETSLSVDGEGTAVLSGEGSYELNGATKEWANSEENESDEIAEGSGGKEDDGNAENISGNNTSGNNSSAANSSISGNQAGF